MKEVDKKIISLFQGDLPLTDNPYEAVAKEVGITEDELVEWLQKKRDEKKLKRVSAILYHQNSGFTVNAMIVLQADEERFKEVGEALASLPIVSHCYERSMYLEWPYNMYAMSHGRRAKDIEPVVHQFMEQWGIENYDILYSEEELKKSSMIFV